MTSLSPPTRAHVESVLGLQGAPGGALPSTGYGSLYLRRLGLHGAFDYAGGCVWAYRGRRAAHSRDPWAAAVLLAEAEDADRRGGEARVELRAVAALVMAAGDAWMVGP